MSLSIAAATAMLQRIGVTVPPQRPPSQRHLDRVKEIQAKHDKEIADLRAKTDKRIDDSAQYNQELVMESRLQRRLSRERSMEERRQRDRADLEWRRGYRKFLGDLGTTLNDLAKKQLEDEISGATDDSANPQVQAIVRFLQDVWTREGIDIRECADPRLANGTASRSGKWVEIGPIRNLRLGLIALHESGHVVHPEVADRREVLAADKFHKISVPCELAAWRWVLDHTPVWTEDMRADMTRFLNSYRSYAIETEATQIDQLCSELSFLTVKLRIAMQ